MIKRRKKFMLFICALIISLTILGQMAYADTYESTQSLNGIVQNNRITSGNMLFGASFMAINSINGQQTNIYSLSFYGFETYLNALKNR